MKVNDARQIPDNPIDIEGDIVTAMGYSDWKNAYADMLSDIEGLFRGYRHINTVIDNYTLGMFYAKEDSEELKRQVQVLSGLFRKMSERISMLCESSIRSLELQLDIISQKDRDFTPS